VPLFMLYLRYGVIAREEAYLERRFGADYAAYRRTTRRWY
jgi:protein-S-isoprenylcysteine O-methyltransferase Ste14